MGTGGRHCPAPPATGADGVETDRVEARRGRVACLGGGRQRLLASALAPKPPETPERMANIESQKKRNRQNEKRRARNQSVRSELKTRVRTARTAIDARDGTAPEATRLAQKRLGKAGANGVVHKNQVARRTSRLMKRASRAGT